MIHTTVQSRIAQREQHRQEAGFDDERGGRLGVDGRGNDGLNSSLNDNFCFSDQLRKLRRAFCFLDGGEGEPIGIEVNEGKCEGAD